LFHFAANRGFIKIGADFKGIGSAAQGEIVTM
jgi:hypothetical protein